MAEEGSVSKLKEMVKALEDRVRMFHDLPKDVPGARAQYRQLERELGQLIEQRDSMFERLVDKK